MQPSRPKKDGSVTYAARIQIPGIKSAQYLAPILLGVQKDRYFPIVQMNGDGLDYRRSNLKQMSASEAATFRFKQNRISEGIEWTFNKDRPDEPYDSSIVYDPEDNSEDDNILLSTNRIHDNGWFPDSPVTVWKQCTVDGILWNVPIHVDYQDMGYAIRCAVTYSNNRFVMTSDGRRIPHFRIRISIPEWNTPRVKVKEHPIGYAILGVYKEEGKHIDHINQNPLDNRRCNLDHIPIEENMRNKRASPNTYTGIIGLSRIQKNALYYVTGGVWGTKTFNVNSYSTERECIVAALTYLIEKRSKNNYQPVVASHNKFIDKWNLRQYVHPARN